MISASTESHGDVIQRPAQHDTVAVRPGKACKSAGLDRLLSSLLVSPGVVTLTVGIIIRRPANATKVCSNHSLKVDRSSSGHTVLSATYGAEILALETEAQRWLAQDVGYEHIFSVKRCLFAIRKTKTKSQQRKVWLTIKHVGLLVINFATISTD